MATPPDDRSRSYAAPTRRRRRFTAWTILAPAAAIILWVSFFSALGKSCVFKECADAKDNGSETAEGGDARNKLPRGARAKVKSGDSLGALAKRFELTEDELKACNPLVDPQSLQPGQYLIVSAVDCEDADKAEAGANPDPLAGDLTDTAPDPTENGTAAADPTANDGKKTATPAAGAKTTETSADQGDEG
ncbi:MAG: LysM domain [Thermoleophilia bacterium]|nr:LysM domain [Thermoleophilia bacterium]